MQVGDAHVGQFTYPDANAPNLKVILAEKSDLIFHFSANISGMVLTYYRGGVQGQIWEKSPVFDDLGIDTQGFDPARIKIASRALDLFRPVQLPRPADPISLLESQRALQESSFARLQLQLEKVFEQTIDLREQLEAQVRSKETVLEDSFKQKQIEADQRLQKQTDDLENREQELVEQRRLLDESDNTFARRQIRERMLSDVSERVKNFGLSEATVRARRPVAMGIYVLMYLLFGLLLFTGYEIATVRPDNSSALLKTLAMQVDKLTALTSPSTSSKATGIDQLPTSSFSSELVSQSNIERIFLWLRFSLLSLGLAASILYYIRWQNQWATSYATTEQSLQQFHIDVNRANWVVETCLEWRKETKSDIPTELINSLTRGLFAGRDTVTSVLHPADELASALMGSASKLSLNVGGNTVEIDKPGKIPKTVQAVAPVTKG
ncbi:hypothetical protein [Rhodoferax sp. TS-BS-61-7]|uniref:hypothetical protein n=1 Tax=Rhodoferax sp. TS-BS-61-7 TaxID=2094194 RepID=UPI000CF74E6A|nr:hypothetical protein [Rhodoferax sp. TS-BS-61-7]PQA78145.1 hypothetical protein C5F53_07390 [Rhodoferax sp. TS-BS-61-7]